MLIYHYSKELYSRLLTRRANGADQEEITRSEEQAERLKLEAPYIDHISFFFDPIPSVVVEEVFRDVGHATWYKGSTLYEYVIDTRQFQSDVLYRVVESRRKTEHMDQFIVKHNWTTDDPKLLRLWINEIEALQRKWGELGNSRDGLERQCRLNAGCTAEAFILARSRPDFDDGKYKYAANVPHLMVYPEGGKVAISKTNRVVIGSNTRTPVKAQVPARTKW